MSREMAVIALGVWVILIPYLGVPGGARTVLLVLTGIAIAVLGFLLRADTVGRTPSHDGRRARHSRGRASFVESVPAEPATAHEHDPTLHPQDIIDGIISPH